MSSLVIDLERPVFTEQIKVESRGIHNNSGLQKVTNDHDYVPWRRALGSALGRIRTCDQEIRRLLLYPLSYEGLNGLPTIP